MATVALSEWWTSERREDPDLTPFTGAVGTGPRSCMADFRSPRKLDIPPRELARLSVDQDFTPSVTFLMYNARRCIRLKPSSRLGLYELTAIINAGGVGKVYRA